MFEILEDLQSVCSLLYIVFELFQHAALPFGSSVKVHVGENDEAFRIGFIDVWIERSRLAAAHRSSAQVHHHLHIQCIRFFQQELQGSVLYLFPLVIVDIMERKLRA